MSDVTFILSKIEAGDPTASHELLPLVYDELRKLAAARMFKERPDHTLQATALVHEAFVRLVNPNQARSWDSRGHFFAAAAEAMRRILIESARAKRGAQRGGNFKRVDLGDPVVEDPIQRQDILLDLDERLCALEVEDSEAAQFAKLRIYAGLSTTEAGKAMGMSRKTAFANWEFIRSWFATVKEQR